MFDKTRHDWYPTIQRGDITFGPNRVISSDGRLRPALAQVDTFTVHYIGAGSNWLDHGDTADELAGIERNHAIPQNKPNEYNSASDSEAVTWEWAGRFRAAHAGGHNATSWGHLVVKGGGHTEVPTAAQADALIKGIRRARTQLVAAGALTRDHRVLAHSDMPGASTGCPGRLRTNADWWARITAPLPGATIPDPDPEDDAMDIYRLPDGSIASRGTATPARRTNSFEIDVLPDGRVRHRSTGQLAVDLRNPTTDDERTLAHWISRELAGYDRQFPRV